MKIEIIKLDLPRVTVKASLPERIMAKDPFQDIRSETVKSLIIDYLIKSTRTPSGSGSEKTINPVGGKFLSPVGSLCNKNPYNKRELLVEVELSFPSLKKNQSSKSSSGSSKSKSPSGSSKPKSPSGSSKPKSSS